MFSTIDGNCRHLRHINFLRRHVQRQLAGMDGEWGFHTSNFQPTCQRHDFNINKISEYKCNV